MAADKDESVLGNLPRERPGRRSDKRASGKRGGSAGSQKRQPAAGATASRAGSSARAAATTRRKASGRAASGGRRTSSARKPPPPPAPSPSRGPDPVGDALRLAGKVAEIGIKTAGGILRRLPGR